jgi:hypothetical protein
MSAMRSPALPSPYGLLVAPRPAGPAAPAAAATIRPGSVPTSRATPPPLPSGRSVTSRSTSTGVPKLGASSWMPPESVMASAAGAVRAAGPGSPAVRVSRMRGWPPAALRGGPHVRVRVHRIEQHHILVLSATSRSAPNASRSGAPNDSRRCAVTSTSRRPDAAPRAARGSSAVCGTAAIRWSASTTVLPVTWMEPAGTFSASRWSRAPRRRREVHVREHARHPPQDLLRERPPLVAAAQPRLHVADLHTLEEADQRAEEDGRRVALHQHQVGAVLPHQAAQPVQAAVGHVVQVLPLLHDAEVPRRLDSPNTLSTWSSRSVCWPVSASRDLHLPAARSAS